MTKSKNQLRDEDRALWQETMRLHAVKPNKKLAKKQARRKSTPVDAEEAPPPKTKVNALPKPKKWTKLVRAPTEARHPALRVAATDTVPALERAMLERIGDGKRSIDARLDLHGKTQSAAHSLLLAFIADAFADGARTLLIITGKGKDSGGVLKTNLKRWLEADGAVRGLISAISPAHAKHGGDGAFYVVLRKRF